MMQPIDIQRVFVRPLPESDFKPDRGFLFSRVSRRFRPALSGARGSIFCRVEQLVARLAHNQKVAGSSPAPATIFPAFRRKHSVRLPALGRAGWIILTSTAFFVWAGVGALAALVLGGEL